jgi:hypothetical protein
MFEFSSRRVGRVGHYSMAVRIQTTLAAVIGSVCNVTIGDSVSLRDDCDGRGELDGIVCVRATQVVLKSVAQEPLILKAPVGSSGLSSGILAAITVPSIIGGLVLCAAIIYFAALHRRWKVRLLFTLCSKTGGNV